MSRAVDPAEQGRLARVATGFRAQAELYRAYAEEHRLEAEVNALEAAQYTAWAASNEAMADATVGATFDDRERGHRRHTKARRQADALESRIRDGRAALDEVREAARNLREKHKPLLDDMRAAMLEDAEAMAAEVPHAR